MKLDKRAKKWEKAQEKSAQREAKTYIAQRAQIFELGNKFKVGEMRKPKRNPYEL